MRVVLTTVNEASVTISNKMVAHIKRGFLLLVGFTEGDDKEIIEKMVSKLLSLRVFPDENGQINISLDEVKGEILSVSQFTLYADTKKGRRPSFVNALRPSESEPLYDYFNKVLKDSEFKVETGFFGADMKVMSINDGPFTLLLDSKEMF